MADPTAVDQFIQITNADEPTARFFLSAANGDCDAAVSAFFESDGIIPAGAAAPANPTPTPTAPAPRPSAPPPAAPPARDPMRPPGHAPPFRPSGAPLFRPGRRLPARRAGGIATLGSLERERDDDEKGYYAGGEKSGQMIQDPNDPANNNNASNSNSTSTHNRSALPPSRSNNNDPQQAAQQPAGLADAILEQARTRGPRTDEERAEFEGPQRFSGAGYRLGDTDHDGTPSRPTVIGRRNVTRILTFYANGFRVDDGPLRTFDDPANEAFLADVNRGVVPKEMEEPGVGDVSITLVDRKEVDYVEKRRSIVPFSGGGQRLDGSSSSSSAAAASQQDKEGEDAAGRNVIVDDNLPVARVQVRLVNGARMVARLNLHHTIADLRALIRNAHPTPRDFDLATTFPRLVLSDNSASIQDSKLNGAVVVQSAK